MCFSLCSVSSNFAGQVRFSAAKTEKNATKSGMSRVQHADGLEAAAGSSAGWKALWRQEKKALAFKFLVKVCRTTGLIPVMFSHPHKSHRGFGGSAALPGGGCRFPTRGSAPGCSVLCSFCLNCRFRFVLESQFLFYSWRHQRIGKQIKYFAAFF